MAIISVATDSHPSFPITGRVGSSALVSEYTPFTKFRCAATSGKSGTPHDSLNGTHATMHGCELSRSIASTQLWVNRRTVSVPNAYGLGISSHTSNPITSAQYKYLGSSIF